MENQSNNVTVGERLCVLSFDEMNVDARVCYDQQEDKVYGPYSQAQVVMARGLCRNWKQPIFFDFDTPMTGKLLKQIILRVQKIGFVVVGVVSDMGGKNKVWNDLKLDYKNSCFENPSDTMKRIWVFQDVPHMIKLLRNHFIDTGFTLPSGKRINKTIIERVLLMDAGEIRICPKLKQYHLSVSGRDRQRVRPACELFSAHVAQAISYLLPNEQEASEYFKLVNDAFDVLNSRIPVNEQIPTASGFGINFTDQENILRKFHSVCEQMRVGKNISLLPFQKGFMMSIRSLFGCFTDLKNLYGIKYILTSRLNQDCLENLFSQIRALGRTYDHPLPVEFKNRLRLLIMGRNISDISFSSSAVELERETGANDYLTSNLFSGLIPNMTEALAMIENDSEISDITLEDLSEVFVTQNNSECSSEGLRYLAGYIAFRCRDVDRSLGDPTGELLNVSSEALHQGWIEKLSRGGLLKPTEEWLDTVKQFEIVFVGVHGNTLNSCNVIKGMCNNLQQKFPHVHPSAIRIYARTRTFIRIRSLNAEAKARRAQELQRKKAIKWKASAKK